jgi:drug/metabolite transporter (DMT)-like permease
MKLHRLKAYFYLVLVAVIWGIASPVIKHTLQGISSLPFLTYRFALSSAVAIPTFLLAGIHIPKLKETLPYVLLYGFLVSTVALGLLFLGLEKTTVLDMTLITAVGPLLIALAGVVFLKEHITSREKVGMALAFSGSFVMLMEPLFNNGANLSRLSGNILVILYLLINTLAVVIVKKLLRSQVSPLTLTNTSFMVGFLTMLPITLVAYGGKNLIETITQLELPFHLGVIYMALISGNLAYVLWVKAQKTIEISEAALFAYLYPIFSTPLAVLWLKESITPIFIIGAFLIATGVVIAEYKPSLAE